MRTSRQYPMKVLHTQGVMNTHPALLGSKSVSTGVALRQRIQQRLGLLQVRRVKALGEPAVDRGQQVISLGALALELPQASQAGRGAEFPRFRLLALGNADGVMEAALGFSLID